MPTSENTKQQATGNSVKRHDESSVRKSIRKAPGTRLGTIQDWRFADNNSGKASSRHGSSIRDGR